MWDLRSSDSHFVYFWAFCVRISACVCVMNSCVLSLCELSCTRRTTYSDNIVLGCAVLWGIVLCYVSLINDWIRTIWNVAYRPFQIRARLLHVTLGYTTDLWLYSSSWISSNTKQILIDLLYAFNAKIMCEHFGFVCVIGRIRNDNFQLLCS